MDEDNGNSEPGPSGESSRKTSRGPTLCKKLKKRIANQNLECSISLNENVYNSGRRAGSSYLVGRRAGSGYLECLGPSPRVHGVDRGKIDPMWLVSLCSCTFRSYLT